MKINLIDEKEILDFETEIGYELEVNERDLFWKKGSRINKAGVGRFYVQFAKIDIKDGSVLIRATGNGNTIDEALKDYCKEVSCQTIVFDAMSPERQEITFPKLVHTKLLNQ